MKRRWRLVLSIVVGFSLLGGVLYWVGWRRIFAEMRALGVAGITGIVGSVLLAMAAWTLSWWIILRSYGIRLPLPQVIGARLSGYAISYLTPTLYFGGRPVGTVFISAASRTERFQFEGDRETIRQRSIDAALGMALDLLAVG